MGHDDYMTTAEVADYLRSNPDTVRYWRYIGYGPASFRVGRRVLYARDEVTRWANEQREKARANAA